jgi:opacity protein-like surface antigen
MKWTLVVLAASTQLLASQPAIAQGLEGAYAGVELGAQSQNIEFSARPAVGAVARGEADNYSAIYGAFGGLGTTLADSFYLGGELSVGAGGRDAARQLASNRVSVSPELRFSATGRAGYLFGEGSLLYAKGGWEMQRYEVTAPGGRKTSADFAGAIIGIGFEQQVGEALSLRAEFLRTAPKDKEFRFGPSGGERLIVEPSTNRLMIGGAYHF